VAFGAEGCKITIRSEEATASEFKQMLRWLYMGECLISQTASEVLPLLQLTDEYRLSDLQRVCEDQIIDYMDAPTAV
jgi:hypothetical protein